MRDDRGKYQWCGQQPRHQDHLWMSPSGNLVACPGYPYVPKNIILGEE